MEAGQFLHQGMEQIIDPRLLIKAYDQTNPGVFAKHLDSLACDLLSPSVAQQQRHLVWHWTGTSTGGKSVGILAALREMESHPLFIANANEGRQPFLSYRHIMSDVILARKMGIITSPQGQITLPEYQSSAHVSEYVRYLALNYLPGPLGVSRPHLHIEDMVSLTAMCLDGAIYGSERGGIAGLRKLITNGELVYTMGVNTSEEAKEAAMMLREVVPLIPDDRIHEFLQNHGTLDLRPVKEIRDSYKNCGDRATRDQHYDDIAHNIKVLYNKGLGKQIPNPLGLNPEDWRNFIIHNPKEWEIMINGYIVTWMELLYGHPHPSRAAFVNPKGLSSKFLRVEDRERFDDYDTEKQLIGVQRITGDEELKSHLQELKIIT